MIDLDSLALILSRPNLLYFLLIMSSDFYLCCSSNVFTDKRHVAPKLSLTNVKALNYLLRSEIFVSEDKQLRAIHLILDFKPISEVFQEIGHAIRAGDSRINRIDVSRPHFLARDDLPPVAYPFPHGIPLVIRPIQQVPLEAAAAGEGIASSNSSLEEEIDKFHFGKEEPQGVQVISDSNAEDEPDKLSSVHASVLVVASPDDTLKEENDEMALNKGSRTLRELMAARNQVSTSKEANKSQVQVNLPPPVPQFPANLEPKKVPELKKKRPNEVGPQKGTKQQKVAKDNQGKRSTSVDSREGSLGADVCRPPHTWSPKLEVDGAPIPWDATV